MTTYRVGTSGYSYDEWVGQIYPADLSEREQLRHYANHCPTVELNSTFYRVPSARVMHGWGRATPEEFVFTLKVPRRVTHDLKLRDAAELISDFCDMVAALKQKLGVLLFQLPPFLKRDVPRLEDFLHQMPPGYRCAFEFRHPSWFHDEVYLCLRRFGMALCISDASQRAAPWEATADFGYFRLRQPDYDEGALRELAERMEAAATNWGEVFAYFKHEKGARGPVLANRLQGMLTEAAPAVAEL